MSGGILLATINAKWIHPSLALRLLKANLGPLEEHCDIAEFALRQPLREKTGPILAAAPRVLGLSVSIWNHAATLELLRELNEAWRPRPEARPFVVLGGPEVSFLPPDAEILSLADRCVRGEGEVAFRKICESILAEETSAAPAASAEMNIVDIADIKSGYRLYSDEDLRKKLTYVEASRGCPYSCEFCMSAVSGAVRDFPLEPFLAEVGALVDRGAPTLKFLDRSLNGDTARAVRIMEFLLGKLAAASHPFTAHFETVPFTFPRELVATAALFPPGTLRLEVGIQTLNAEVSALIGRPSQPESDLETLRVLRRESAAIIHADLIAGLPGEDMESFGVGFDRLWEALTPTGDDLRSSVEIQIGMLKLLPGAPIARHSAAFAMVYDRQPPYEVLETAAIPADEMGRLRNFARFWELIVNRGLADPGPSPVFRRFMALSDSLLAHFGRNWGIAKDDLRAAVEVLL